MKRLTAASYALLGYLTMQPQSAFELTKLIRDSGALDLWPRTTSSLYLEPPNLVDHGFATVSVESTGKRTRSVYAITDEGRKALLAWLEQPGNRLRTADDIMLRVFYANLGSKQQLLEQLATMREQIRSEYVALIEALEKHASGTYEFSQPAHLTRLVTRHELALMEARARWLADAEQEVASWPGTQLTKEQEARVAKWYWTALDDTREALARFERTAPAGPLRDVGSHEAPD